MSFDPVLISSLTATSVTLLTRFVTNASVGFAEAAGTGAWNATVKLFDLVRSKLKKTPTGETSLDRLRAAPKDEKIREEFSADLRAQLESDPTFRTLLVERLSEANRAGAGAVFNVTNLGQIGKLLQIDTVRGDVNL